MTVLYYEIYCQTITNMRDNNKTTRSKRKNTRELCPGKLIHGNQ